MSETTLFAFAAMCLGLMLLVAAWPAPTRRPDTTEDSEPREPWGCCEECRAKRAAKKQPPEPDLNRDLGGEGG